MTGHSTGVTPGYLARVRRNRMLDRLGREADRERVKAEILVIKQELIPIMGWEKYLEAVDLVIPDAATFEQVRDGLQLMLDEVGTCHCNGVNRDACPSCRAAATADLDEEGIPY